MTKQQTTMFQTEDLPLFSGTPQRAKRKPFQPQDVQLDRLPGLDFAPDWEELAERRHQIVKPRRRRKK